MNFSFEGRTVVIDNRRRLPARIQNGPANIAHPEHLIRDDDADFDDRFRQRSPGRIGVVAADVDGHLSENTGGVLIEQRQLMQRPLMIAKRS